MLLNHNQVGTICGGLYMLRTILRVCAIVRRVSKFRNLSTLISQCPLDHFWVGCMTQYS